MIRNITKKKVLMPKSAIMRSYFQKSTGLMLRTKVEKALVFPYGAPKKMAIHMFLVFVPIDIIFLNDKNRVVEIAENIIPFSFYLSKNKASTFIELPKGAAHGSRVGDLIKIN
ncbi:MAG: DUF192 domain-containing protein [Nanoarchaeota archaeon]|nr:MAG: DUF192 domain-containing protein [Nanoarchaeota archaeon]